MVCPNCGDIINNLSGKCPSCGFEASGLKASEEVRKFSQMMSEAASDEQRLNLIKTFPIPNTKEDI